MSPRSPVRAVTSSSSACAARFDGRGDAVEHEVVAVARRGDRDPRGVPAAAGTGDAPRADDLAGDDPGQDPGAQLGRPTVGDRGRDDVGGRERSRRHQPAHLLGDDHEIEQPRAAEAAAAVGLGHEERGPPQLGAARPPRAVEAVGGVGERRAPR